MSQRPCQPKGDDDGLLPMALCHTGPGTTGERSGGSEGAGQGQLGEQREGRGRRPQHREDLASDLARCRAQSPELRGRPGSGHQGVSRSRLWHQGCLRKH